MNCHQFEESLWLYLYDEMAAEERSLAEAHLSDCGDCRVRLSEAGGLRTLLSQREVPELAPEQIVEARMALDDALDREERSWRGFYRNLSNSLPMFYASRAAGVVAVLAVGFGLGWMLAPPRTQVNVSIPAAVAADSAPVLNSTDGLHNYQIHNIRDLTPDPITGRVRVTLDAQGQVTLSGSLDNPQIQRVLLEAVRSYENPGIRRDSLGVLRANAANRDVRDTLIYAMLNDSNDGVRMEALDAVRSMRWSPAVRDSLVSVVRSDRNAGLRIAAVNSLVRNADRQMLPALREFAERDGNAYVRLQCASAVRRLEGEEF